MLFPKKVKYRKWQTKRQNPKKAITATRGSTLAFGSFGLKAMSPSRVTSNQIEASRRVMRRALGKNGNIWTRVFPDRPYTAKGAEVGMGKGKGDPKGFVVEVFQGRVLFEVDGVSEAIAREVLRKGGAKMPVKTKVVTRSR
ncbi:50S ribosomal protein L16 [Candidatus Campbellbacteria bacterium]|nr:MAG: 50S ribosomal protein L16 [Candidatus Campbellbacteria bacterium]